MKRQGMHKFSVAAAIVGLFLISSIASAGQVVAWGSDDHGQVSGVPAGTDYVAIAAGDAFGVALAADGAVIAWGDGRDGQLDVPVGTYVAVGAGARFGLAVRNDGSIVAWGDDSLGQVSGVPAGDNFVAVDGGLTFAVALRNDGTVAAWGDDRWGQVSGVPRENDFVAVAAGDTHAVALRADGSLVSWGYPTAAVGLPTAGVFSAIDAGGNQSVALAADGSVVWWGQDPYNLGLAVVPTGTDYVGVAAGYLHDLALKADGSAVGWGAGGAKSEPPDFGQARPPKRNDLADIAGGLYFSLALTAEEVKPGTFGDNFNDNSKAIFWRLTGNNLDTCRLTERNSRLELTATNKAVGFSSSYVANGWGIDPKDDFALRFFYHQAVNEGAALRLVLTPEGSAAKGDYLKFGVTSSGSIGFYTYEAVSATSTQNQLLSRQETSGVLYLSYDATLDELYLSFTGYGRDNAWATAGGFLQGAWDGRVLGVALEGTAGTVHIDSGQAYFDDFVVESGDLVVTEFAEVWRFWSPVLGSHFYTIDESERDNLIDNASDVWTFEGPVFLAATTGFDSGLAPVYRLWSDKFVTHFYTISEAEREAILADKAGQWTEEGVAFYAYPDGQQPADAIPVYRFWRPADDGHFYTADEAEKDTVQKMYKNAYVFEGIVFYVPGK